MKTFLAKTVALALPFVMLTTQAQTTDQLPYWFLQMLETNSMTASTDALADTSSGPVGPATGQSAQPNGGLVGGILIVSALVLAGAAVIYLNNKFPPHHPGPKDVIVSGFQAPLLAFNGTNTWVNSKRAKLNGEYYVNLQSGVGLWYTTYNTMPVTQYGWVITEMPLGGTHVYVMTVPSGLPGFQYLPQDGFYDTCPLPPYAPNPPGTLLAAPYTGLVAYTGYPHFAPNTPSGVTVNAVPTDSQIQVSPAFSASDNSSSLNWPDTNTYAATMTLNSSLVPPGTFSAFSASFSVVDDPIKGLRLSNSQAMGVSGPDSDTIADLWNTYYGITQSTNTPWFSFDCNDGPNPIAGLAPAPNNIPVQLIDTNGCATLLITNGTANGAVFTVTNTVTFTVKRSPSLTNPQWTMLFTATIPAGMPLAVYDMTAPSDSAFYSIGN